MHREPDRGAEAGTGGPDAGDGVAKHSTDIRGELQAKDGYRAVAAGDVFRVTAKPPGRAVMWETQHLQLDPQAGHGDLLNATLLLQDLCRFRNAGGDVNTLQTLVTLIADLPNMPLMPADWRLLTTQAKEDGNMHIFYHPKTGEATVWVEDQYVDQTTVEQIREWVEVLDGDAETSPL